jgi:hypothetical protein
MLKRVVGGFSERLEPDDIPEWASMDFQEL